MINPNLPQEKIKSVVVSTEYAYVTDELKRLGISIISSVEACDLPFYERFHADMQIHNFGNDAYFLRNSCSLLKKEIIRVNSEANIIIESQSISEKYPNNISLNGAFIGDYYICNESHSNRELLRRYIENGIKIINVKQGYAKCSTVIVSHNAIITDDDDIYNKCRCIKDIEILKADKGSVRLRGYDYGFIGGCSLKLDKNTLAFCGDVRTHSDYHNIKTFCKNHNVELLSLSNDALTDIGGLVAVK